MSERTIVLTKPDKNRQAHIESVRLIGSKMINATGMHYMVLELAEAYHMTRLHCHWFSLSRKEKQV